MNETPTTGESRVHELDARVKDLESQLDDVRAQLSQAELDQWQGRIDDLELQLHLASLEVQDQVNPILDELRNTWLDARERLTSRREVADDVLDALRGGMERAMSDLRRAASDSRAAARS